MKDFFNPKSMVTPGAAGAVMMFLANGICSQFPELAFRYVALALSVALASVVLKAAAMKMPERVFYWMMNALVIFVVGVGSSNVGVNLQNAAETKNVMSQVVPLAAVARTPASVEARFEPEPPHPAPSQPVNAESRAALQAEIDRLQAATRTLLEENRELHAKRRLAEMTAQKVPDTEAQQGFFNRW